ncbi:MAG TPA: S16 family serine protease [Actinomycetota bacterium]|nr:S16 family serine protease [Actinomycetota bacterium]
MRRKRRLLAPLLVALVVASIVRLPYYSVEPGLAVEIGPLIRVDGHPSFGSAGRFVLASVEVRQLTPVDAVLAWVDPSREVLQREELFMPGETREQEARRAREEMMRSEIDAVYAAVSALGEYPGTHGAGALVESVVAGCPAEGRLRPGDVIVEIDGSEIGGRRAAGNAIDATGDEVDLVVRRGTDERELSLAREPCAGQDRPLVGVSLVDEFPFDVAIADTEVGGPSAGLLFALAVYDRLTPGDLTAGRTIAGTGTIDLRGRVGPIGGIEQKVQAAERTGADLFLVPNGNLSGAERVAGDGLVLIAIRSFDEAVSRLEAVEA